MAIIKRPSLPDKNPLAEAEPGATKLTMSHEEVIRRIETELRKLKSWINEYEIPQM